MYPIGNRGLLGAALAALLGACNPGGELLPPHPTVHCTDATCESVVSLVAPLATVAGDVAGLEVRVCRNQVCVVSQPTPATDGAGFVCAAFGLLTTRCTMQPASGGGMELRLSFVASVTDLHDGDAYVVQVASPGGGTGAKLLLDVQKSVVYQEQRPNGPDCEPLCRSASL